ncbi:MAG: hypothetical protein Q8P67_01610, partial [archaeon]|nr:hypothetical protein [archaeon]
LEHSPLKTPTFLPNAGPLVEQKDDEEDEEDDEEEIIAEEVEENQFEEGEIEAIDDEAGFEDCFSGPEYASDNDGQYTAELDAHRDSEADDPQSYNSLIVELSESSSSESDEDEAHLTTQGLPSSSSPHPSLSSGPVSSAKRECPETPRKPLTSDEAREIRIAHLQSRLEKEQGNQARRRSRLLQLKSKCLKEKGTTVSIENRISLLRKKVALLHSEASLSQLRHDATLSNCNRISEALKQCSLKIELINHELDHLISNPDPEPSSQLGSSKNVSQPTNDKSVAFSSSSSSSTQQSNDQQHQVPVKKRRLQSDSLPSSHPPFADLSAFSPLVPIRRISGDFFQLYSVHASSIFSIFCSRNVAQAPEQAPEPVGELDVNQVLCWYQINGECEDDNCTFQHFPPKPPKPNSASSSASSVTSKPTFSFPSKRARRRLVPPQVTEYFLLFASTHELQPTFEPKGKALVDEPNLSSDPLVDELHFDDEGRGGGLESMESIESVPPFERAADFQARLQRHPHQAKVWLALAWHNRRAAGSRRAALDAFLKTLAEGIEAIPGSTVLWLCYLEALRMRRPLKSQLEALFHEAVERVPPSCAALVWKMLVGVPLLNSDLEAACGHCDAALQWLSYSYPAKRDSEPQHRRLSPEQHSAFLLHFIVRGFGLRSMAGKVPQARLFLQGAIQRHSLDLIPQHLVRLRLYLVHLEVYGPLPLFLLSSPAADFWVKFEDRGRMAVSKPQQLRLLFEEALLSLPASEQPPVPLWLSYLSVERDLTRDAERQRQLHARFSSHAHSCQDVRLLGLVLCETPVTVDSLPPSWETPAVLFAFAEQLLRDVPADAPVEAFEEVASLCGGWFANALMPVELDDPRVGDQLFRTLASAEDPPTPLQAFWIHRLFALTLCVSRPEARRRSANHLATVASSYREHASLRCQLWIDILALDPSRLSEFSADGGAGPLLRDPWCAASLLGCFQPQDAAQISKLLAVAPTNPFLWYFVALHCHAAGDTATCLDVLENGLRYCPSDPMLMQPYIEINLSLAATKRRHLFEETLFLAIDQTDLRFCKRFWTAIFDSDLVSNSQLFLKANNIGL